MPAQRRRLLTTLTVALALLLATPVAVIASDRFTDVPDTNVFHDDITWMADAGVTKGCNPPANTQYCPSDNVTREQMAAFMHRLAANQVVDAGKLNGENPSYYQTVIAADSCSLNDTYTATTCGPSPDGTVPDETTVQILETTLNAPAAGSVAISIYTRGSTTSWVTIDSTCVVYGSDLSPLYAQLVNGLLVTSPDFGILAGSTAVNVAKGSHVLRLCTVYLGTDGGGGIANASLSAVWSASGNVNVQGQAPNTGGTPLDLASPGGL